MVEKPITIAALMPTIPAHYQFLPRAVDSFLKQVYPGDWNVQLIIDADPKPTLGAKLNRMIASTTAEFIVLLDSDDIHSSTRVWRQIAPLLAEPNTLITGTSRIVYQNEHTGRTFRYSGKSRSWIGGLAFRRTAFERHPFENVSQGVDTRWLTRFHDAAKLDLGDDSLFLALIHPDNTCKKHTDGQDWTELPAVPEYLRAQL